MIKLSYLSEHLNAKKLKALIEKHNSTHPPEFHLKLKGAANLELPSTLMSSFFQTLFENIKAKVNLYLIQVDQLIHQVKLKN